MYVSKIRGSEYMRQILIELQGEIDKSIIIIGITDISRRHKNSKNIEDLYISINQLGLTDILEYSI